MAIDSGKKLKSFNLFGNQVSQGKGNTIKPTNEFVPFNKEEINQSLVSRFEKQVEKYCDRIAVKSTGKALSYRELNSYANHIGYEILQKYDDRYKLTKQEKERYTRQMLLDGWGIDSQEKLKGTTVFVAGAGGSGSGIIQQLALCGIGTIIVCDFDEVELSNLNRQILHDESRIGLNKAVSAEMTIKRINPNVNVVVHQEKVSRENIYDIVGDSAIIFDNVDDLEAKFIISECAVKKGIPHIISSMIDINSYVAIFHSPKTPCFHCLYDREKLKEIEEMKAVFNNYQKKGNSVAAPSLFVSTGFAVNEALKIILDLENPAYNKYFLFNQKGTEEIVLTDGYSQVTFPFSEHFKEICKEQDFDWDKGWRGNFLEELSIRKDDNCPICGEKDSINSFDIAVDMPAESKDSGNQVNSNNHDDKNNQTVAILFEHDVDMIVGMMGVLKSGKIYVPLDPTYPKDRLAYMLENSESRMIITNNENEGFAEELRNQVNKNICIINIDKLDFHLPMENLKIPIDPNQIAYILYTSGSTGLPKGIMQSHRNVMHFISAYTNNLHICSEDKLTLLSSYSFDAAVMDIYGSLLNGAILYPFSIKREGSISKLVDWILSESITIYHSIPTVYRYLTEELTEGNQFPSVRLVVMGGEVVYRKDVETYQKYFSDHCIFINGLGPTESTVTLQYFVNKETRLVKELVPVGFPVEETQVYLIGEDNKEVGINEPGEIVYESDYLALGYWNNEGKTKEVFVINPITNKGRVYKTGDLGKRLNDGSIEFIGRKDFQVKVRGYRIELEEIEGILDRVKGINKSVVISKQKENKENYLVAYYVKEKDHEVDESNLKSILAKALPDYMVPSIFIGIEEMPLTASGKVDRKAISNLKDSGLAPSKKEFEGPTNEIERKLVEIWQEVLKTVHPVSINDNFLELGGHSLRATKIVGAIHKEFNVAIPLVVIFNHSTIKQLAQYINEAGQKIKYDAIEAVEEKEYYLVSSAQKRMYMLQELDQESTAYNISGILEIEGRVDVERANEAFLKLIERHESLRTSFENNGPNILQKVHKMEEVSFKVEETKLDNDNEAAENIRAFIQKFDLTKAPLIRAKIIKLEEERNILIFDMHHIISDGTSVGILVKDFAENYGGRELEKLRIQYKDFSEWQNKLLESDEFKKQEEYWLKEFEEEIPVINLPTDYNRPAIRSFKGDNINFVIGEEETRKLRELAKNTNSTMYMVLLSAFKILLSKYTGQADLIVGSPIAGRQHTDTNQIVGMFVNTLAIRSEVKRDSSYKEYLMHIKEKALKAYENQDYQFEDLVEKVGVRRDLSRNPIFDVMFTMQNMDMEEVAFDKFKIKPYSVKNNISKFDMTLVAAENKDNIFLRLEYSTALFKKRTIESLSNHLQNILKEISENVDVTLSNIDLISHEERVQLLDEFNDTKAEYPRDKTIHQIFEEQVNKTPHSVAVAFKENTLTYKELNDKSNQLAKILVEKGVKSDTIVGIMVERSIEMVIGILAILKAGGAYLPIDMEYPKDRILYMLEDSGCNIILTQSRVKEQIEFGGEIILLDDSSQYIGDNSNLPVLSYPENIAYIIYTSGSTGNPKGVMVEHRNVVRLLINDHNPFKFSSNDIWTMFHSFCFDFSVWEMYGALLYGGKLVIVPKLVAQNPAEFLKMIKIEGVTVLNQTPSAFYNIISQEKFSENLLLEVEEAKAEVAVGLEDSSSAESIRYIIFGGEALKPAMLRPWRNKYPKTKLINMYGITETTVHVTYKEITDIEIDSNTSNIGRPIPTLNTYVMDTNLKLLPVGVSGELCVGGEGVARGYLNKPELTAEKFVQNPYKPEEKIYRSGDLVKLLPEGEMEYIGRIDFQVKIRGYRIELGEIENRLLMHEGIKEAVVIDKTDEGGNKYLCAYIVTKEEVTIQSLKDHLAKDLPDYMIPAYFVEMEELPLSNNGKINRKALPEPLNNIATGTEYVPPSNDEQREVLEIWQEVLGNSKIGIRDDFFSLGGDSFKALRVVSKLKGKITLADLFQYPTVELLWEKVLVGERSRTLLNKLTTLQEEDQEAPAVVCIPYGGGSSIIYKPLADTLSQGERKPSLYAIELPGHGMGAETDLDTVSNIAAKCVEEIKNTINKPVVLYGHCVGVALTLEIARLLEAADYPLMAVGIGAILPVNRPLLGKVKIDIYDGKTDQEIHQYLKSLGGFDYPLEVEELSSLMKSFRHDVTQMMDYFINYYPSLETEKIKAPIYNIVGDRDILTKNYKKKYKKYSTYGNTVHPPIVLKDAGHYFIKSHGEELARVINRIIESESKYVLANNLD